jgi:hypothetical protein
MRLIYIYMFKIVTFILVVNKKNYPLSSLPRKFLKQNFNINLNTYLLFMTTMPMSVHVCDYNGIILHKCNPISVQRTLDRYSDTGYTTTVNDDYRFAFSHHYLTGY